MTDSAYDDTMQCPDGGRCSHVCGKGGACYRVLHCAPLTSYGEGWADEVKELHVLQAEYDELRNEFFAVAPFEMAFRSAQRTIGELETELNDADSLNGELVQESAQRLLRSKHLQMVLRSIVGAVDGLRHTANKKPSSLVHVPRSVIEYARSTLAAIDEEEKNGTH
jgi:hypothetical protein